LADGRPAWREQLRVIIFEADTPAGKAFDVALLVSIMISVSVVMAESVRTVKLCSTHVMTCFASLMDFDG
jgi:voltage-gated potassium channel